jgi:hypothetical protein
MDDFNDPFTKTMLDEYNLTQQEQQQMREYAKIMGVLQDSVHELNVIKEREKEYLQLRNQAIQQLYHNQSVSVQHIADEIGMTRQMVNIIKNEYANQ